MKQDRVEVGGERDRGICAGVDGGTFALWIKALKEGVWWGGRFLVFLVFGFWVGLHIFHVGMIGLGWFVKYRDQFKPIKIEVG